MGAMKWNTFAGGTSAVEGKRGYQARTKFGIYDISAPQIIGRRGYLLYFINDKGILRGGLWQKIGVYVSPNEAKGAAKKHFSEHFAKRR